MFLLDITTQLSFSPSGCICGPDVMRVQTCPNRVIYQQFTAAPHHRLWSSARDSPFLGPKHKPCIVRLETEGTRRVKVQGTSSTGATGSAPSVWSATDRNNAATALSPDTPNGNGSALGLAGGGLARSDFTKFVQFFRQASPYIEGHRGRTFVIVVPGNVSKDRALLQSTMSDIALLHGLGVRLVLVLGTQQEIDAALQAQKKTPKYVGSYRITDRETLQLAIQAAGQIRTAAEQYLSKGPAIPMFRRHRKADSEIHFEPAMRVVSGNYVTAKRRGVIDGVDFGYTGEVRFVLKDDIKRQLENNNIVLLSNLGFTAAGEVLNCNTYDVGLHAAVELSADKLFFLHLDEVSQLQLPQWLPLSNAQKMLLEKLQASISSDQLNQLKASMDTSYTTFSNTPTAQMTPSQLRMVTSMKKEELLVNLDIWSAQGFPAAVSTCVIACSKGVKRAHLLDARLDGGLLLELYSRDGVGTMISTDFYEGIRRAVPTDVDAIASLLAPLEEAGITVKRTREELLDMIGDFTVIERETKVMGCALLLPLGRTPDGVSVAELGAFCVEPAFRGSGRGDSLLDYIEQDARSRGIQRLVLLTTRTADWFEQRDFRWSGAAYASDLLPSSRRLKINAARNSQLYAKQLEVLQDGVVQEPGKRIGF